ncbi:hypothetical protein ACFOGI_10310 [Virgibacillus xinjiangensis]|uniref:Immunoglobulin-like domain of spore germination n=1 Tax=Virgibacillus xinjiangensis TaxID=393090 RepID=A0ABV7CW04_9BACI
MKHILILFAAVAFLVGCSGGDETEGTENQAAEQESSPAVSLRNIDVLTTGGEIQLTAEAKTTEDEIYYKMEQGETLLVEETGFSPEESEQEWGEFQLNIEMPEELDPSDEAEAPIITIFAKDQQGELVNPNYIPVDMNMDE